MKRLPVNETIIHAISRLVDDALTERRDPSHATIEYLIKQAGLNEGDPNKDGKNPVGKTKRIRAVLSWALEFNSKGAESFTSSLLSNIRASGGFRKDSQNFVGQEAIINLKEAFKNEGVSLGNDGALFPVALESLTGLELTLALEAYTRRAKNGIEDAALLVGTSKDLIEAVSAHVLQELWGSYSHSANFPMLLGQAFSALGLATPADKIEQNEHPQRKLERAMYEMACAINILRNKQGTGHGRPLPPDLEQNICKSVIEFIGVISEYMLNRLKKVRGI